MDPLFCQSCGMPMTDPGVLGTNRDGSDNHDYCVYCYKDGAFVQDVSMDEMIEHCLKFIDDFNNDSEQKFTKEEARAQMEKYFPQLKRWK